MTHLYKNEKKGNNKYIYYNTNTKLVNSDVKTNKQTKKIHSFLQPEVEICVALVSNKRLALPVCLLAERATFPVVAAQRQSVLLLLVLVALAPLEEEKEEDADRCECEERNNDADDHADADAALLLAGRLRGLIARNGGVWWSFRAGARGRRIGVQRETFWKRAFER